MIADAHEEKSGEGLALNSLPRLGSHMKLIITLALITFGSASLSAQTKTITASDYDGAFEYAVSETNAAFPFIFTVQTQRFENGKLVSTDTTVNERQAAGVERETKTLEKGGQTFRSYSVMVGFGNGTYCSPDGVNWKGPQKFVCPGPDGSRMIALSRPRESERVEYSVAEKLFDVEKVKVYRKFSIFAASTPKGKRSFEEEVATIDSRGFFVSIVDTEGALDPEATTIIRKQSWNFKTKFKPIDAPK